MKQTAIVPSEGWIVIKPFERERVGSVVLHDRDALPQFGTVIAVGRETVYPNTTIQRVAPCKVGDNIVHAGFGWQQVRMGGETMKLISFADCLGVII